MEKTEILFQVFVHPQKSLKLLRTVIWIAGDRVETKHAMIQRKKSTVLSALYIDEFTRINVYKYSQTWVNDHLPTTTTFWGSRSEFL